VLIDASGVADVTGFVHTDLSTWPNSRLSTTYQQNQHYDYCPSNPSYILVTGTKLHEPVLGSTNQGGISASRNGGSSWTSLFNPNNYFGGRVAVSADCMTVLWAPMLVNIQVSNDNGTTWADSTTRLGSVAPVTIWPVNQPLAADRVNASVFYAINGSSFWRSVDRGQSFTSVWTPATQSDQKWIHPRPGVAGEVWVSLNSGALLFLSFISFQEPSELVHLLCSR
jgi:hypothetical protein